MWVTKERPCPGCGAIVELEIELGSAFCPECDFFDHLDNLDYELKWRSGVITERTHQNPRVASHGPHRQPQQCADWARHRP